MSRSNWIWIFGSLLIVFVFSLVFGNAPVEMRRVGLFYLIFGGFTGGLLAWFTREISVSRTNLQVAVVVLLIALGSVHVTWVSYSAFRQTREQELQQKPQQLAMLKMFEESTTDALLADQYEKIRRQWQPEFPDYLQYRLSGIGEFSSPWPECIWGVELLLATCCGTWLFRKSKSSNQQTSDSQIDTFDAEKTLS